MSNPCIDNDISDRFWSPGHDYWTEYGEDEYLPADLEGRYYRGRNLMIRPWKNLDPGHAGLSDSELDTLESRFGLPLPALYREHMKQQNGGYFRHESYLDQDKRLHVLFVNDARLESVDPGKDYVAVADIYDCIQPDEWAGVFGENPHLERLYLLSCMSGHSILLLDYGCGSEDVKPEPEVCFLDTGNELTEVFRAPSYARFIEGLVYGESEWFLGIKSSLSLEQLAQLVTERLLSGPDSTPMVRHEDDRQGWYNHDAWYSGLYCDADNNALIVLLPNQNRCGTHAFHDDQDCPYILSVDPRDSSFYGTRQASRAVMEEILRPLGPDAVSGGLEMRFILPRQEGHL